MEAQTPFPESLARLAAQQEAELLRLARVHKTAWHDALRGDPHDRQGVLDHYSLAESGSGENEGRWRKLGLVPSASQPTLPDLFDPVPANPWEQPPKDAADPPSAVHAILSEAQVKSVSEGTWNRIYMSEDDESIASSISSMGGGPALPEVSAAKSTSSNSQAALRSTRLGSQVVDKVKPVDFHLTDASLSGGGWSCDKVRLRLILDYVAGGLVFLNCILLMLELEVEGRAVGAKVGYADPVDLSHWMPVFKFIDTLFIFIFLLELLIRLWAEWPCWHRDLANLFDACLVVAGMVDLFILVPMAGSQNDAMMRVVRTLKSFRSVRLLRTFRFVRGLRLLVQACQCFLPSLCWSMVLLAVFMSMGALVLGNLLLEFAQNDDENMEDRQWIWLRYGTAYRALYTLYEITFAGNWPTNVRPVLNKVSHAYVIFFLLYITIVVFAVIRVITAIFLKDTLDAAQNDSENLVVERLRKKAEYVEKLEAVFRAIDKTGDGMITEERLEEILSHPKVEAYFNTLDLDVQETSVFFHIIDNGDGEVTLDEFIDGILRCKGQARAVDSMAIRAELKRVHGKLNKLHRALLPKEPSKSKSEASKT